MKESCRPCHCSLTAAGGSKLLSPAHRVDHLCTTHALMLNLCCGCGWSVFLLSPAIFSPVSSPLLVSYHSSLTFPPLNFHSPLMFPLSSCVFSPPGFLLSPWFQRSCFTSSVPSCFICIFVPSSLFGFSLPVSFPLQRLFPLVFSSPLPFPSPVASSLLDSCLLFSYFCLLCPPFLYCFGPPLLRLLDPFFFSSLIFFLSPGLIDSSSQLFLHIHLIFLSILRTSCFCFPSPL